MQRIEESELSAYEDFSNLPGRRRTVTPIQQVSGLGKQLECWERAEDQPGGNEGTTPSAGSSESKDIYVESPQLLGELWKDGA